MGRKSFTPSHFTKFRAINPLYRLHLLLSLLLF